MKQIELKKLVNYDPDTGEFTSIVRLAKNQPKGAVLGSRTTPEKLIRLNGSAYSAGCLAVLYERGKLPDNVGYIDGNRHNTRWSNLKPQKETIEGARRLAKYTEMIATATRLLPGSDFSAVTLENYTQTKWTVTCEKGHTSPRYRCNLLYQGAGCPVCTGRLRTVADKIAEARKVHGDAYGYDKITSVRIRNMETISCPAHGDFRQQWADHVHSGAGCPKCYDAKRSDIRRQMYKDNPDLVQAGFKNHRMYKWGRSEIRLHGYEPQAVDYLRSQGYKRKDVLFTAAEGKPTIQYELADGSHTYVPDLYLVSEDTVVEVKSSYTWYSKGQGNHEKNLAKLRATRQLHNVWLLILNADGTVAESVRREKLVAPI